MGIELAWVQGGTASVMHTDGALVTVRSTRASAPGTPLVANTTLGTSAVVRMKVQDCRREADGAFVIRGRWLDLSRATREEIVGLMQGG